MDDAIPPSELASARSADPIIREETEQGLRDLFDGVGQSLGGQRLPSDEPLSWNNYALAMLPRTGSTALCSLLARTRLMGHPDEYFNPRGPMQYWARQLEATDLREYVTSLRRQRATRNGVFGFKATFYDLEPLLEPEVTREFLGDLKFVYLTREDLVAQSVSEYIAEQTGLWHQDQDGNALHSTPHADPASLELDEEEVLSIVDRFTEMSRRWEEFFASCSVDPLRITYEQFCADPQRAVHDIATHLGVTWDAAISMSMAITSQLADARNEQWAERVRARLESRDADL